MPIDEMSQYRVPESVKVIFSAPAIPSPAIAQDEHQHQGVDLSRSGLYARQYEVSTARVQRHWT